MNARSGTRPSLVGKERGTSSWLKMKQQRRSLVEPTRSGRQCNPRDGPGDQVKDRSVQAELISGGTQAEGIRGGCTRFVLILVVFK